MLVLALCPPLPPRLHHWQPMLFLEHADPGQGASNRHISINIPRVHPQSKPLLDEMRVDPVASIGKAHIGLGHKIRTLLEFNMLDMQGLSHADNIEEVVDAKPILTVHITLGHEYRFMDGAPVGDSDVVVAGGVDVEDAGVGVAEHCIESVSYLHALLAVEVEGAGSQQLVVVFVRVVSMFVKELVLVHGVALGGRIVAFLGVRAGISHHYALEVETGFPRTGQFVVVDDLVGQVGHVDAGIALAGYVEVIFAQIGELLEESQQSRKVILGCVPIVICLPLSPAESDSSRRLDVQQVGSLVPGVVVEHQHGGIGFEQEGTILINHTDEAGASGPTIEPQDQGIVIGVMLRVEEDVVVVALGEVEVA